MHMSNHPAIKALSSLINSPAPVAAPVDKPAGAAPVVVLDSVDPSSDAALSILRASTAASLQEWAETSSEDLGDGETLADRLTALMVGLADEDKDGDISDDEAAVIDLAFNSAWDYLAGKGASDEDLAALLNENDAAAADRVAELLRGALPEGEEASMADVDAFAFDAESRESVYDCVGDIFDAVYKKTAVVRDGKKVRINKRVSGTVRLSGAQRAAIAKARRKAHSATATIGRMKSLRVRERVGLNK